MAFLKIVLKIKQQNNKTMIKKLKYENKKKKQKNNLFKNLNAKKKIILKKKLCFCNKFSKTVFNQRETLNMNGN